MSDNDFPKPEDIQKEFEEFIQKKFGNSVKVISQSIPLQHDGSHKKSTHGKERSEARKDRKIPAQLRFNLKPKDITSYLDRFVIGQAEAKKALSIAICDHYNEIVTQQKHQESAKATHYVKQNILITGPTGVGKTYMIQQVAKMLGVPFVKADATRFSETGYMGANVEDMVKDLVHQANGDINKAKYGIIYLDEADKLATSGGDAGRDVSGRGVQLGLLKLMEETEVDLCAGHDPASQIQALMDIQQKGKVQKQIINTKHILFVISGAFTGLDEIISQRRNQKAIGFSKEFQKEHNKKFIYQYAKTEDFIKFGLEPEFVGRLPIRVSCDPLDKKKYFSILKYSSGSFLNQYKRSFQAYNINLEFTDDALHSIAEKAEKEKTGARGLMTVCEHALRNYKFHLPGRQVTKLTMNQEAIINPQKYLAKIIDENDKIFHLELEKIRQFEESFSKQHKMKIKFTEEATKLLYQKSKSGKKTIDELCTKIVQSYEYGLKLIQQNTGQNSFSFGVDVIKSPKSTLEKMIKSSYADPQRHH